VNAVKIGLEVVLVLANLFLIMLILMHKGKGGGLSDMFGGGMSSSLGGSTIAERNLDRFTIAISIVWFITILGLGLLARFAS
jgi:preprotein translocase subunit SecG